MATITSITKNNNFLSGGLVERGGVVGDDDQTNFSPSGGRVERKVIVGGDHDQKKIPYLVDLSSEVPVQTRPRKKRKKSEKLGGFKCPLAPPLGCATVMPHCTIRLLCFIVNKVMRIEACV